MGQKTQQLTLLKQQLGTVATLYGTFIGSENIPIEALSSLLVRIVQVAKHEFHPILWALYFYKPRDI